MVSSQYLRMIFIDVLGLLFASLFEGRIIYGAIKCWLLLNGKTPDFADTHYFSKTGKFFFFIILIIGGVFFGFLWCLAAFELFRDIFSL